MGRLELHGQVVQEFLVQDLKQQQNKLLVL
jgi:hypothetical protein